MSTPPHRALGWPEHGGLRVASDDDLLQDHGGLGWPGSHRPVVSRETEKWNDARTDDVSRETSQPSDTPRGDVSRETSPPLIPPSSPVAPGPTARVAPPAIPSVVPAATATITSHQAHRDEHPQHEPHSWGGTRVLTVANQKGGVGKTTTAVNIAAAMATAGLRVLVIDMDPQGNASTALSIPHLSGTAGIYDVLIDGAAIADVVQESPQVAGLWCVPATIDLAGAEIELVPLVARENRLRRALTAFLDSRGEEERFDMVLIDCPPSLGLLTVNAFVAAREVLIPIQCEYYALEGLSQLLKNVELIRQHLNADLVVSTILLTMFDARTRLASDVAEQVREHFGDKVLRVAIPRSVRISEAPSHGETVITYDPGSSGALSYTEAAAQMRQQEVLV